ncbi:hypothetical protein EDC01DRAFT_784702 [Geopyxis carbonaria]|nr:hypothetical protein EDC01DRAFT_784702 [Geopyxis carbonaria]
MLSLVLLALPALAAALGSDSDYTTRHPKGSMRLPGTSEISSPLTPRALSCNVGSLPCDDGTGCCPVGRFCMIIDGENGCCPIGDTCTSLLGCSVGFYECADSLGGDCCPTGSTCTADHKCRKGNSLLDTLSEPSSTASASSTATEDWTPPAFPTTFSSREDCSDQFDPAVT